MSYSDHAIRELQDEWLKRKRSVEPLAGVLADKTLETPLVIGIYGDWGSGKTSAIRLLQEQIEERAKNTPPATDIGAVNAAADTIGSQDRDSPTTISLWIEAWKFARQNTALWRALLLAVIGAPSDDRSSLLPLLSEGERQTFKHELDELTKSLYRSQTITEKGDPRVNWGAAVPAAIDLGLGVAAAGLWNKVADATGIGGEFKEVAAFFSDRETKDALELIEREQATRYRDQVTSLEQLRSALEGLVRTHIVALVRRLHMFVDDLDRCLSEDALVSTISLLYYDVYH